LASRDGKETVNVRVVASSLATFSVVSYVLYVLYGAIVPKEFHLAQFLEAVLPGFKWLTVSSFFVGLIESFVYGVYAGLIFTPIYNFHQRKWG